MECLKKYCEAVSCIDGLQTFVISPSKLNDVLNDNEILVLLKKSYMDIAPFINTVRLVGTDKIYLAFVNLPVKEEGLQWLPLHCYKDGNQFYHVQCKDTWICRECRNIIKKSIIMPMVEADATIFHWCVNKYPDIPLIFQKVKCPKCGRLLQNHLLIIE